MKPLGVSPVPPATAMAPITDTAIQVMTAERYAPFSLTEAAVMAKAGHEVPAAGA